MHHHRTAVSQVLARYETHILPLQIPARILSCFIAFSATANVNEKQVYFFYLCHLSLYRYKFCPHIFYVPHYSAAALISILCLAGVKWNSDLPFLGGSPLVFGGSWVWSTLNAMWLKKFETWSRQFIISRNSRNDRSYRLGVPSSASGLKPAKVAAQGRGAQNRVRVLAEFLVRDGFFYCNL